MFREMRRKDKQRPEEDAIKMFEETHYGVLSVLGDDGYPYGVPLNHVYLDGKLYFHCALKGHKIDAIRKEPKVSYCVIGSETSVPEKRTTIYKSAVCFGKARIVDDPDEKMRALVKVIEKHSPGFHEEGMKEIDQKWIVTNVIAIDIEHMTAKGTAE